MWWNSTNNCTASNNPFFNVSAPHNFSVYHDFKHTYSKTRSYFKDVLQFWLKEYKVDGFRFDLSKGLVQYPSSYDAGGYSSERIGIISDYANAIKSVESDAYIILEHFCDQSEENYLYNNLGALCWNNSQMNGYMETVMGWTGDNKSDFSNFKSGRVNNIETHDEERLAYKAVTYGQSWAKGWSTLTKRLQAAYALHFLTPYPKMMWQFGELGYDISIEHNGRTGRKPLHWDYLDNTHRKALYDAMSKIISFRTSRSDIYAVNNVPVHTWRVGDDSFGGKHLVMDKVIVVANFSNTHVSFSISVPKPGTWTNLMTGSKVTLGSTYNVSLNGSDYIILVREKVE
jgi:1,4-alpha-glucan branching enzyme